MEQLTTQQLLEKIKNCTTKPQLDELRKELVIAMGRDAETFHTLQTAFIKKQNQLRRIPISQRSW